MQAPGQQNITPSPANKVAGSYAQQTQYPQQATQTGQNAPQSYAPTSTQTQSSYPGMTSSVSGYPASQPLQQPYSQPSQQSYPPPTGSPAGAAPYSTAGQTQTQSYQVYVPQQQQQQQQQQQPATQNAYGSTQGYPTNQQYSQQQGYSQYGYNYPQQQQTYPTY